MDLKLKYIINEKGNTREFYCKLSEIERGLFNHLFDNPKIEIIFRQLMEVIKE